MPAHDRRTPGELLAEADQQARLLLLDVSAHSALAMLPGFPTVAEAAAQLWSVLQNGPRANGRALTRCSGWSRWPAVGVPARRVV
jgi:hypothetical protein